MTKSANKPKWSDYFPDQDAMLTADEVVARVHERGHSLDLGTFRYWQRIILPLPVRRRHRGAQHALYPEIAVDFVEKIRVLQQVGMSLSDISALIKDMLVLGRVDELNPDPLGLETTVIDGARILEAHSKSRICRTVVTFFDERGYRTAYTFPVPERHEGEGTQVNPTQVNALAEYFRPHIRKVVEDQLAVLARGEPDGKVSA